MKKRKNRLHVMYIGFDSSNQRVFKTELCFHMHFEVVPRTNGNANNKLYFYECGFANRMNVKSKCEEVWKLLQVFPFFFQQKIASWIPLWNNKTLCTFQRRVGENLKKIKLYVRWSAHLRCDIMVLYSHSVHWWWIQVIGNKMKILHIRGK